MKLNGAQPQPDNTQWRERAVNVSGTVVDFSRGGVQLIGRGPLDLNETVVCVGFATLFQIVGSVLQLMDSRHPAHDAVRQALLSPQLELLTARESSDVERNE